MSYIAQVPEAQADPRLKQLYGKIQEHFGFLPNYFQALGHNPRFIEGQLALSEALLGEGALSAALKEELVLVVSGINSSSYCIAAHMELLRRLGVEKSLGRKLATDYLNAPVPEKEKALFHFAAKLTRQPADIEPADVEALRQAGWSEEAVLEAVLAVAWGNFINRVSFGLGLVADF